MITFTYQNQNTNTYLVYEMPCDDRIDTVTLGMITNNKIAHILPAIYTKMDNVGYVKYNVSSKISLKQFYGGTVNKKRLIKTFKSIVSAFLETEDYMIDSNSIVLDSDYIFVDVTTCEAEVVCVPIRNILPKKSDMAAFFKNIVFSMNFNQEENCDYVAKIINYLNNTSVFSISGFKQLLDSMDSDNNAHVQVSHSVVPNNSINYAGSPDIQTSVYQKEPVLNEPKQNVLNNTSVSVPKQSNINTNIPSTTNKVPPVQTKSGGFDIPNKNIQTSKSNITQNSTQNSDSQTVDDVKPMSMMYLLQHYSKENAALYKAQKNAKKSDGGNNKSIGDSKKTSVPQPNNSINMPNRNYPVAQPSNNMNIPNRNYPVAQPGQNTFQVTNNNLDTNSQSSFNTYNSTQTPIQVSGSVSFGETTVLGGVSVFGETTVLSSGNEIVEKKPYLLRVKNNEKILINKENFRIGKEKSFVDYFIGDNTAISRSHANIIVKGNDYFIVDTNSTNHTFVNGKMIQSNIEIQIFSGDKIRLANEEFGFVLC